MPVVDPLGTRREHRLPAIDLRHHAAERPIPVDDRGEGDLIERQRTATRVGDGERRQVISGGAEPAGAHTYIRARRDLTQDRGEVFQAIADGGVPTHLEAELGEPLAEPRRVRVGDLAGDDFIALRENFDARQAGHEGS